MRLLLLPALLVAAPALAQQTPPPAPGAGPGRPPATPDAQATVIATPAALMIAGLDADGDARVTRAEFEAGLKHAFDTADPAHAGTIGYIAYSDWSERWMGDRNTLPNPFEVDRDGDNRISFAEMDARFGELFDRLDKNKDGVLVRSELVTIRPPAFGGPQGRGKGKRR